MTICPNKLQCATVVTVVRPVTQVEVVAVKRASIKGVTCPFAELIGKHNNPVPISIATTKLNRSKCVVDKDNLLFIILFSPFLINVTAFIIINRSDYSAHLKTAGSITKNNILSTFSYHLAMVLEKGYTEQFNPIYYLG